MARIREFLLQEVTRHGKTRYLFHRRPDGRRITIKGLPGEADFEARYNWLANGGDHREALKAASNDRRRRGFAPVTVADLSDHYFRFVDKEVERRSFSQYTAQHYARFTNKFVQGFGPVPLASIQPHQLERILDDWSGTDNAWNNALRPIKHMFRYAEKQWGLRPNPAKEIEKRKVVTQGFEPWEDRDIEAYFKTHMPGSNAHLAMRLLLEAAPRRADLVKLGPQNLIQVDDKMCLRFTPQKTQNKSAIPVTIPISDDLLADLKGIPSEQDTFLITSFGHSFTAAGFGNKLAQWRDEAGVRPTVATHGIRKSVGINMAENDATPYEIMAALGHSSPKVTKVYTEAADRRKLAAKATTKSTLTRLVSGHEE
ncbi:tyrosine-type recombinase/integrase [Phaeobacter piscinae]|uniref:tyrosine-type recombinase/integrase n=1 Tax=Phaeobacter piscinae TaxID=1580596 RepID=UPI000590B213|nr:tyrosine-type recombinase/integrase [Phaeobacter piscinae]UTS82238.1 Tyrosine recombinase XerC [Phaeobacter piscinae]